VCGTIGGDLYLDSADITGFGIEKLTRFQSCRFMYILEMEVCLAAGADGHIAAGEAACVLLPKLSRAKRAELCQALHPMVAGIRAYITC